MNKINYQEILKEARQKAMSPHTIIKRKLHYRKATGLEPMCKYCKSLNIETVDHKNNSVQVQCEPVQCKIIGEGFDGYSEINLKFTCDSHKK